MARCVRGQARGAIARVADMASGFALFAYRNQEKSNSLLNRYLRLVVQGEDPNAKRPSFAGSVDDVNEADRWRRDIVREISRKIGEIQNSALPEQKIRDLNDEINKLLRVKRHWERRVEELGGPSFKSAPTLLDSAVSVKGSNYYYFGAARELPGVAELFHAAPEAEDVEKTRAELYRGIDGRYYGFRDEEDGRLCALESAAERRMLAAAMEQATGAAPTEDELDAAVRARRDDGLADCGPMSVEHVPTPDEMQAALLEKRKRDVLAKYALGE